MKAAIPLATHCGPGGSVRKKSMASEAFVLRGATPDLRLYPRVAVLSFVVWLAAAGIVLATKERSPYRFSVTGDETGLVHSRNSTLRVPPDVVFTAVEGGKVFGVRRLDDVSIAEGGYWGKCEVFVADDRSVQIVRFDTQVSPLGRAEARSLEFANRKCRRTGVFELSARK